MTRDVRDEQLRQPGQGTDRDAERDRRAGRQAWRSEHARVLSTFARTMSLMHDVSRTEESIADTLQAAASDGSQATARRLQLAEAAVRAAHVAAERRTQLQRQADRLASHADVAALLHSAHHAATALADLAHAEKDIAGLLTSLADRSGPERAAQLRREAEEALASAHRADNRARSLHDLAASVTREKHPPSPGA